MPLLLIATWFGIGQSPKAPGTMASLAALPLAWIIHATLGSQALLGFGFVLFALGVFACNAYLKHHPQNPDPKCVVIDEVAAQCMVLAMAPLSIFGYALGFVLFRVFDIFKPWPISLADRNIKGGIGIMVDDMLAAITASIILAVVL